MAETSEVVIVGGGIVGCATAYFLAKKGVRATIIEKEEVARFASGFSAGLLNPIHGYQVPGLLEALSLESFRIHLGLAEQVKAETGIDPAFRPSGCIWVMFNEAEAGELLDVFNLAQKYEGFSARWLDAQEVKSIEPRLSPRVMGALCIEGMRQVSSYEYTLALSKAAEKYGATIRRGAVEGLREAGGRVTGVVLEDGEVACEKVLLAMGPWTGQVEGWLGTRVPVEPLKGQILRLELEGPPMKYLFERVGGGYVSYKPDGLVWVGTTEERVGFDDSPTQEARESIMAHAQETMPALSEARVALQTACLRPASEDGLPIIGEVPGRDGVYLSTGAGRKGILLGPAMAQATADLIATGRTDIPIGPFSLGRFLRPA